MKAYREIFCLSLLLPQLLLGSVTGNKAPIGSILQKGTEQEVNLQLERRRVGAYTESHQVFVGLSEGIKQEGSEESYSFEGQNPEWQDDNESNVPDNGSDPDVAANHGLFLLFAFALLYGAIKSRVNKGASIK